jgi:probable metal-binding protein
MVNHIHEVLAMIHQANKRFTRTSLQNSIAEKFGEDARFSTCGDHLFGIDGVLPFLLERNKIRFEDGFITPVSPPCNH